MLQRNGRARGKAGTDPLEEELTSSGGGGIGTTMKGNGPTKRKGKAPQRGDAAV